MGNKTDRVKLLELQAKQHFDDLRESVNSRGHMQADIVRLEEQVRSGKILILSTQRQLKGTQAELQQTQVALAEAHQEPQAQQQLTLALQWL